jgi:hypothetical protein
MLVSHRKHIAFKAAANVRRQSDRVHARKK